MSGADWICQSLICVRERLLRQGSTERSPRNHEQSWVTWTVERTDKQGCGIGGDFHTPEMTEFQSVSQEQWESNVGIDPFSKWGKGDPFVAVTCYSGFGYNEATPVNGYRNASAIVHTLVAVVSHPSATVLLPRGSTLTSADGSWG
jgi:hypothetical protein